MDSLSRKKVAIISKYAQESFTESDWLTFAEVTGAIDIVSKHPRLLRSLSFGDDDYPTCVATVLDETFRGHEDTINDVIDFFDIELWYQQKEPEKYRKVFETGLTKPPEFWTEGYLRLFISHLTSSKVKAGYLKDALSKWGVSAFVAHTDITPSKEWRLEIEQGLLSMDLMLALVEPGFKESDWCVQEIGFALGRRVEILPLRAGLDPFGFFAKYQWIDVKGKIAADIAQDIAKTLLRKPMLRPRLLASMSKAFAKRDSDSQVTGIQSVDSWNLLSNEELKSLIEGIALTDAARNRIADIIRRVGAFKPTTSDSSRSADTVPF